MKRVLILCTGNSCRSQIAEAILNKMGQGEFQAFSAGSKSAGFVHPMAIQVLEDMKYSTEGLHSKSMEDFRDQNFDVVITVCDRAKESCPTWPNDPERIHWSFEDPVKVQGTEEQKLAAFRKTATEMQQRMRLFLSVHSSKAARR